MFAVCFVITLQARDCNLSAYKKITVLKNSAEAGDTEARFLLGWMYYSGKHMNQNYTEAAKWSHIAAEQGH
ncbi:MAG: hypothetical protein FWF95_01665 [Syntrophorhabdaceae bacterium]|nr:hypothetical protein [Syntrophorhabdaceae bacterium]